MIGLFAGVSLWGLTLGSAGPDVHFLPALASTPLNAVVLAALGGAVFNIANLLLVAAIELAGMAVAFPVGIGLALIVGALSSYVLSPQGSPLLLFGGVTLVVTAIVCDSLAYRARETGSRSGARRGLILSLICGVLMGTFYPLVSRAMDSPGAPGPYAIAFFFVLGVGLCSVPVNYLFMKKPIDGQAPVSFDGYTAAPVAFHAAGILGGVIWVTGAP